METLEPREAEAVALGALLSVDFDGREIDDAEWRQLARKAVRERLAPVLYERFRGRLPGDVESTLRGEYYRTGAFNAVLYRDLAELLSAAAGLSPPVLLKGAALATTLYGDPALRPMSDLDILVTRDDVPAWSARLLELGYRPLSPEMAPGHLDATHYHSAWIGGATGDAVVELHWSLVAATTDWRSADLDWFRERTEPWRAPEELGCPDARQLEPTARLLYLSAHAVLQHGAARARLLWTYDVHRLLTSEGARVDWVELIDRARELDWSVAVHEALAESGRLFGTEVPGGVLERLAADSSPRSASHVRRMADPAMPRAELVWTELGCLPIRQRLELVRGILFPAPSYLRWRYSGLGPLWPLGYPARWSLVAKEGASLLLALSRGRR